MRDVLLIGFGGFLGAVLRYGLSGAVHSLTGSFEYPLGTLAVNAIGSFLLVFLASVAETLGIFGPAFRAFAFMGLLGAFTTFSTFSFETTVLLADGRIGLALGNVVANVALCLVAALVARGLVLWIWR
ncbi:MAG TPA: fluoride efflux transporter CrcB [Anaerolineales bacterium]|nr:fluoride efflux transporter CrcB [Anaerolineales bacterium]